MRCFSMMNLLVWQGNSIGAHVMAVWETRPLSLVFWAPNGNLEDSQPTSKVIKIADGKVGEATFEVGENVTVTYDGGTTSPSFTFAGTVDVNGVEYPVLKLGTLLAIVGLDFSSISTKTLARSTLDASTFTVCFFPGSLIATPSGERNIEELVSGDPVLIGDSGAIPVTRLGRKLTRSVFVKWIGRQTVSTLFGPAERLMPVRFYAGSLGGGGGNLFNHIAI